MRRHLPMMGAALLLAASTCFLFQPLARSALTSESRFLEWDVPEQYWPDLVYLCGALHEGELPYWNPYDRAGYPFYADPQAGTYHPLNWAICAASGQSPSLAWAEARVILGFFLAGIFGLLWLRCYGLPPGAALLGAVAIQAAPFMRHNWELNLTTSFAYAPLMLWAAERTVTERRLRDGALLGLSGALCAWVGSPPALWLAAICTAVFFLWRLVDEARAHGRAALLRALLAASVAAAFAAGFTLVVLVPGATLAGHSVQAGRDLASISAGGLGVGELRGLVTPRQGNHLYMGLIVLVLAPLALVGRRERVMAPRTGLRARWFFVAMAVAAVMMTLGASGPLFGVAFDWVPGVGLFRLPHRYESWLGPCLGALSAAGLTWLSGTGPTAFFRRRIQTVGIATGFAVVIGSLGLLFGEEKSLALLLLGVGVVGVGVSVRALGAAHLVIGAALSFLLLLDLSQSMPPDRHTRWGPHPGGADAAGPVLERARGTDRAFRYFDEFGISCRSGTRFGRRDFRGYQDPLLLKSHERVLATLRRNPRMLEQYNVRYVLTGPHFIHGWRRHYLPPPDELAAIEGAVDRGAGVIELPEPLPAAYWVPLARIERLPDRPAALQRVLSEAPSPVAILDGEVADAAERDLLARAEHAGEKAHQTAGRARSVPGRALSMGRDRLEVEIEAPAPGMVVVNEAWYPGWRARVDGVEVQIHRVNALVRGVFVGEGDHHIEMVFRPTDGVALRWVLLLTWIAFVVMLLLSSRRLRRRGISGPGPGHGS